MKADELRERQAPLKSRYKEDASAAHLTLRARGDLSGEGIACSV